MVAQQKAGLPAEGTSCRFTYGGKTYVGTIKEGALKVEGFETRFKTFSAASVGVTGTSRNGWMDWQLLGDDGQWLLADDWRKAGGAGLTADPMGVST